MATIRRALEPIDTEPTCGMTWKRVRASPRIRVCPLFSSIGFRAVFRAWRDFIRWHGALARKRREIRANRKGSAAENIYRGSVVLRYLFGRRTFGGMMR